APTPFVAKVAPPPSDSGSAPAAAQPYDPNRPLQGKSPGQAVPQAAQPTPPNTAPGQTNNQTQSSGMLDEPQIVEVPPSNNAAAAPRKSAPPNNGIAAPKPAAPSQGWGTATAKKAPDNASSATTPATATPPKSTSATAANAAQQKSTPPSP